MSWSNYLLLPESKVAIEVGKLDNTDLQGNYWSDFEEFVNYMSGENREEDEELNLEVIKYLWKRVYCFDSLQLCFAVVAEYLNDDFEVVSEESVPKDYKKVSRQ